LCCAQLPFEQLSANTTIAPLPSYRKQYQVSAHIAETGDRKPYDLTIYFGDISICAFKRYVSLKPVGRP